MAEKHVFDVRQMQAFKQRLEDTWKPHSDTLLPADAEEGAWHKTGFDPRRIVAAVPALHVKVGFRLHAYVFQERRDRNGVVWALPDDAAFPDPDDCPEEELPVRAWTLERITEMIPPHPDDALLDVMEAIDGDKSPLSYLSASLLARELSEFAAEGHGIFWGDHRLVTDTHWRQATGWQWQMDKPSERQPTFYRNDSGVTILFYTYLALGQEILIQHVDFYPGGSYAFTSTEQTIAIGGAGFKR